MTNGPKELPSMEIVMNPKGGVTVHGPLNHPKGKEICLELIANAIIAILQYQQPTLTIPPIIPPTNASPR